MKTTKSDYIATVHLDSGELVEIRRLEGGGLVGFDGSYLEQLDQGEHPRNPYDVGYAVVPENEDERLSVNIRQSQGSRVVDNPERPAMLMSQSAMTARSAERVREYEQVLKQSDSYEIVVRFERSIGDDLHCGGDSVMGDKPLGQALMEQFMIELQEAYDHPDIGMSGHFHVVSGPSVVMGYHNPKRPYQPIKADGGANTATGIVATYQFDGQEVTVRAHTDDPGAYDLYDQNGNCLNEGDTFYSVPTREQALSYLETR